MCYVREQRTKNIDHIENLLFGWLSLSGIFNLIIDAHYVLSVVDIL